MKNLLVAALLLAASLNVMAKKTIVSGTIKGFKNDTLTIYFLPMKQGETPIIDQVVCINEKLNYEVQLVSPLTHLVRIASYKWKNLDADADPYRIYQNDIHFFLDSGDQIEFSAEPGRDGIFVQASGNEMCQQQSAYLKSLFPLYLESNRHCLSFADAKKAQDSLAMKKEVRQIKELDKQIQQKTIEFILKHPDWAISAEVLMGLPDDLCIQYYHRLGEKAKTSFFGQYARQTLFAAKAGDKAPNFSLPNRDGRMVSLSDFRGKYVILDFWGTWCGYCVKDIPRLKASWTKYKDRAVFVSIAFRDTEKSWKAALEKYGMDWVNLISPDDKLATIYGIGGYPTKIMLDSDGVIVGKYLGESDDFYKELDRLLGR